MTFLFTIFAIVGALIGFGYRKAAIVLTIINLILILAMFWHHITDVLQIHL